MAWDVLSTEEKKEILALFPDAEHILNPGTDEARPNIVSLMNDDNFRHDCARYTENIDGGRHDREWLEQAWAAHERRKAGDFDSYLANKFEDDWGVEVPENLRPRRQRTGSTSPEASQKGKEREGLGEGFSSQQTPQDEGSSSSDELHGKPEDFALFRPRVPPAVTLELHRSH